MPNEKNFLVIQFLTGIGDAVIEEGSKNLIILLESKGNTHIESAEYILTARNRDQIIDQSWYDEPLKNIGNSGILYLRGHGNWQACTLGGRKAEEVAQMLKHLPEGAIVNVVGCNCAVAAREGIQNDTQGDISIRSFAGELHQRLKAKQTVVFARSQPVQILPNGKKVTYGDRNLNINNLGSKEAFSMMLDKQSRRAKSKWEFYWQGDEQRVKTVVYTAPEGDNQENPDAKIDALLSGRRRIQPGSKKVTTT